MEKKGKKFFSQTIFYDWCKACGICIAFCPQNVFTRSETGKPLVENSDECIGCRFCELHCPDFAITISSRYLDRRKDDEE
ncbi:MAG: 4Fe-4S binding protein [Desulfobulbaceae bacterium]|nr:4Fe-4S binding protein [Desulfobulbaceae bacterium]